MPENVTTTEISQMFRLILHFEGISKPNPQGYKLLNEILMTNNMTVASVLKELSPNCDIASSKVTDEKCSFHNFRYRHFGKM